MKTKYLFEFLLLFICPISFSCCQNNDELYDSIEKMKVYIPAGTNIYLPLGATVPMEYMFVKEEKQSEYLKMDLFSIVDFTYEKGYEYNLIIEKKTLALPSTDRSNISYKLIQILSKEEAVGKKRVIDFFVSAETGYYKCGDVTQDIPQEGMRGREDESLDWKILPFNKIANFDYEKGYNYKLLVEETTLDHPVIANDSKIYRLIDVLSKERSYQ